MGRVLRAKPLIDCGQCPGHQTSSLLLDLAWPESRTRWASLSYFMASSTSAGNPCLINNTYKKYLPIHILPELPTGPAAAVDLSRVQRRCIWGGALAPGDLFLNTLSLPIKIILCLSCLSNPALRHINAATTDTASSPLSSSATASGSSLASQLLCRGQASHF